MADSASFSCLLKSVFTNHSSTLQFQGRCETSQQDIRATTYPRVEESPLEHQAEFANFSTNVTSLTPAATSESNSALAIQKPLLMEYTDHNSSFPHTVTEKIANDEYNWRKYGQKPVKGSKSFRSYYKCSHSNCYAKKQVQCCDHSGQVINTIYIGQHNHNLSQDKCNISRGPVSSAMLPSSSYVVDPVQKMSVCSEETRQSALAESEQQSSSSSNCNIGIKVEGQYGNELESKKFCSREIKRQKKNCGTKINEKHGVEPSPPKRTKESSVYPEPARKAKKKETKVVLHDAADGSMSNDGFRWRKYGQKMVKGNSYLRSYYRCSSAGCPSRKHVETATADTMSVTTKYVGTHNHDMPVPRKQKGSKSLAPSPSTVALNDSHGNEINGLSSRKMSSSTKWSLDREEDMMNEKVLELGGEKALESAQALLSIGIELTP